MPYWSDDTITAIATAPGEAGLCVVRISGPEAFDVADRVFHGQNIPSQCKSHTIHYGHIIDPDTHDIIDEVLLSVMKSPHTFTREDVVEISGHGGYRPGSRILDTLIRNGARIADPGEFTKRAFLNGRIDLLQAEAVAEIIRSRTDATMHTALRQLDGRFSNTINSLRERLINLLALVEVGFDFNEEGIEEIGYSHLRSLAYGIHDDLNDVIQESEKWRVMREGARIAIIGRPNVGKSSLLNALLGEKRAIVDPTPGTTRDTINETVDFMGIPVTLIDTAGMRNPVNTIEAQGITRTQNEIETADIHLWLLDGTTHLHNDDYLIYSQIENLNVIPIINKIDRPLHIDTSCLQKISEHDWIYISALNGLGLDTIKNTIFQQLIGNMNLSESDVLLNARQNENLHKASHSLKQARTMLKQDTGMEIVAIDLRDATRFLGNILGKEIDDDILDRVFSSFCIGK